MKHLILPLILMTVAVSCQNSEKPENGQISNELINNPATADNPTAAPVLTLMQFKDTVHNFGDILEGQKVEFEYEFTNVGDNDLLISRCDASCGCTVPTWPREPIKKGGKGKIKVVFDSSGKSSVNTKNVTVTANIPSQVIILKLIANVRALNH